MKRFLKIGCGAILGFIAITMVVAAIVESNSAPTQSIMFLNTGPELRTVTLEMVGADGKLSDGYYIHSEVACGQTLVERVPEGDYHIKVWRPDDSLAHSVDFKVALPDSTQSNYELYRFDLSADKVFALVNLNFLYEGNSFASHMSKAVGTKRERPGVAQMYDGTKPFLIEDTYSSQKFVDVHESLPHDIQYGNMVYGLFPIPGKLPEQEFENYLLKKITDKTLE
ncbi:hypothetical protein [Flavobacterium selenitireducens]|uniref:hypothetical protein n=1 Tax=Flavobacterium selenitireducens TaxID=2722704 RepID=UPI00168BF459|nr:hypothetical protein [Flavobacterium selenitireducens]MBD3583509.1 hypothetical protein [Flavobacterium selenitireducens]